MIFLRTGYVYSSSSYLLKKYRERVGNIFSAAGIILTCFFSNSHYTFILVLGWNLQFMGSKFGIFGGFGWVCSSVLVDEPGFRRVWSSFFSRFGLGSTHSGQTGMKFGLFGGVQMGLKFGFWRMNLGSSEFEVQPVKFKAIQCSSYLGSIQQ